MKGIIIAGGHIPPLSEVTPFLGDASYIIAADSGYDQAIKLHLSPDLVIGDMDSISQKQIPCETIEYPTQKDFTDSELALDYLMQKGCTELLLLGMTGSRLDHTFSNLLLMKKCVDRQVKVVMATPGNICYLTQNRLTISGTKSDYLSLIPLVDCHGVTTDGLAYPLKGEILYAESSRGISNQFLKRQATITIQTGYLYVIQSKEK